jgi:5-methylcytosine-specific restriction endonuclease McrA
VARKARMRDAFVEKFDRLEIFERDNWICQICLAPIDRTAVFPAPASVSLDHIIPIARGGKHSRANAQTACLGCNVSKGARVA